MKQTIIALIPPKGDLRLDLDLTDKEFLKQAETTGKVLTMSELCKLWNTDEVHVKDWFIRSLEVEIEFSLP